MSKTPIYEMELNDLDKDTYIKLQAEAVQRSIVTYKQCSTPSYSTVNWTFRNTNCDVVAVITTTLPLLDGKMRDINLNTSDTVKLKPPMMKNGKPVPHSSPFMDGLIIDVERTRKRVGNVLKSERKSFLSKLKTTKYMRGALESLAAVLIQTAFRSHYVRTHIQEIVKDRIAKKMIIADMKKYFATQNVKMSFSIHRNSYAATRYRSAMLIQSIFRKYISRKCLLRKRKEKRDQKRRLACVVVQCMFRRAIARHYVMLRRTKLRFVLRSAAAVKIQCGFRRVLAKRRVRLRRFKFRWLAARMIQCWFRARNSRKMSAALKEFIKARRIFIGACKMQCLVRRFLSVHRVDRIRFRRLYIRIFKAATQIQKIIRRFLSEFYIIRYKNNKIATEKKKKEIAAQREADDAQHLMNLEVLTMKENMNIFYQAYCGNLLQVEDLFIEMKSNPNISDPIENCTNPETGDSLLSIAAEIGSLDLVRKCLIWGLDMNQRNYAGLNCLMIATKYHHINVVQYLLSSTSAAANEGGERAPNCVLEPILEDDAYWLLSYAVSQPCTAPSHNYPMPAGRTAPAGPGKAFVLANTFLQQGLSVNSTHKETGMTPLLYACENGLFEGVSFLLKQRALTDAHDENGQTVYHKAAKSSAQLLKGLLGINDSLGISIPEGTRPSYVLRTDLNGKDCALLGAIHGQRGVLDIINDLIQKTPINLLPAKYITAAQAGQPLAIIFAPEEEVEMGWAPADINAVLTLATNNDAYCMSRVLEGGFDLSWAAESTGVRVVHLACMYGAKDVIELCFNAKTDFSAPDSRNRNVMHYAATYKASALISLLFSHPKARECNVTESLLSMQDYDRGDTPVHIVAYCEGVDLSVDLLARGGLEAAMVVKNYSGMTPLMAACSFIRHQLILMCLDMGSDTKVVDMKGRSPMWHLFHPVNCVNNSNQAQAQSKTKLRAPICSELNARKGSRKDRDDASQLLQKDAEVIVAMIRRGSSIYLPSSLLISVDKLMGLPSTYPLSRPNSGNNVASASTSNIKEATEKAASTSASSIALKPDPFAFTLPISVMSYANPIDDLLDSGDIATKELSFSFLKIISSFITPKECWRLMLSCIRFDDGTSKALLALLEGGAIDLLVQGDVNSPKKGGSKASTAADRFNPASHITQFVSSDDRPNSAFSIPEAEMQRLQMAFFGGNTLLGWSIKLGNVSALQQLVKRGYNVQVPVDMMGNSGLHLVCSQSLHNAGSMTEIILNDSRVRIESKNYNGLTPAMMCAKFSNIIVFRKLFNRGVDSREGLKAKYVAWMLAYAKRRERTQINTQTGRYGSDDETYFSLRPTPDYTIWT